MSGNSSHRIAKLLLAYCRAVYSSTGVPPTQLLLGRNIKSARVESKQQLQQSTHDTHAHMKTLNEGERVSAVYTAILHRPGRFPAQISHAYMQHIHTVACTLRM